MLVVLMCQIDSVYIEAHVVVSPEADHGDLNVETLSTCSLLQVKGRLGVQHETQKLNLTQTRKLDISLRGSF